MHGDVLPVHKYSPLATAQCVKSNQVGTYHLNFGKPLGKPQHELGRLVE